MSRLIIRGLPSYAAGLGFGSSIIPPVLPSTENLVKAAFFGNAYSNQEDTAKIVFNPDSESWPAWMQNQNNHVKLASVSGNPSFPLNGLSELGGDSTYFVFGQVIKGQADVNPVGFISGSQYFKMTVRTYTSNGVQYHMPSGSLNATDSTLVSGHNGLYTNSWVLTEPVLWVIVKDATNNQARGYAFSGNQFSSYEADAVIDGTGVSPALFIDGGDRPQRMLMSVGQYDKALTGQEVNDLWRGLKATIESANTP
ncbi:hypothetical protein K6U49_10420 [Vibrio alginolyticus]|uniref:hypothetical protein n=1 Tax=Vibrio TaxID=662 RepID=UPI001EEC20DC|nr:MULTISPECIES: hypothetical protein [Vibrio]MCG6308998.1 hypothetical protein [Vibrio alginolyticus]MDW3133783.1 hypothetical protein [Vibrio sp. 1288]